MANVARYGVREHHGPSSPVDRLVEQIQLVGYAIADGGYSAGELAAFAAAFERAREAREARHGRAALEDIDELHTVRLPMRDEPLLLKLATTTLVLEACRQAIGPYVLLNQQNGVINPPHASRYSQGRYHRDLPYQHFVSSRPLAISALFCLDTFTVENGATLVLPGSHKHEAFPSDEAVEALHVPLAAPAGSFLLLDAMLFHSGGVNRTEHERRGVNHVYTIPIVKPQIDLPSALGESFTSDPEVRRLLGYDARVPATVADYYASRRAKPR